MFSIYKDCSKVIRKVPIILKCICHKINLFALFDAHTSIHHYVLSKRQNCFRIKYYCIKFNSPSREFFLPNGFAYCEFLAPPCSVCDQLERGQSTKRVLQRHNAPGACSETTLQTTFVNMCVLCRTVRTVWLKRATS